MCEIYQKDIKMRPFAELKYLVSKMIYDMRRYECEGCKIGACSQKRHSCLLEYDFGYYSKKALEQLKQDGTISYEEYQEYKMLQVLIDKHNGDMIIDDWSTNDLTLTNEIN